MDTEGPAGASGPELSQTGSPLTGGSNKSGQSSWQLVDHPPPTPKELFPAQDHPLRIVVSKCRSFQHISYRIHLLTDDGVAVGCGWRPKSGKVEDLRQDDFIREKDIYGKCTRCFKNHSLPSSWTDDPSKLAEAPADSDSSLSSGSDTDDSVDTESENEGIPLPLGRSSD